MTLSVLNNLRPVIDNKKGNFIRINVLDNHKL